MRTGCVSLFDVVILGVQADRILISSFQKTYKPREHTSRPGEEATGRSMVGKSGPDGMIRHPLFVPYTMLVKDLIALLDALPPDQRELEICSIADAWAIEVLPPRLSYLNENFLESVDAQGNPVPTSRPVIVI